jgi:type II secretion system protein H
MRANGTTLIELLVVLAIVSVALTLVIPAVTAGRSELQVRDAARMITGALSSARSRAIFRQRPIIVQFDEAHGRILISDSSEARVREIQLPESVALKLIDGNGERPMTNRADAIGEFPSFDFQPDGGVPELSIAVSSGNRVRRVSTDPFAGAAVTR